MSSNVSPTIPCRIVFMDAGNTLFHPSPSYEARIGMVLNRNGFSVAPEALKKATPDVLRYAIDRIYSGRRYAVSDEADEEFWTDVYERLLERLDFAGERRAVASEVYHNFRREDAFELFPDVPDTLESLRRAGIRMGVVSNFCTMLDDVLRFLGVHHYFSPVVISAAVGFQKPERGIFELALERAGVGPSEAALVGDNPVDDVEGAVSAGLTPVLIDRDGRYPGGDGVRIGSFSELGKILVLKD
ncbi:MAG: HAD-IA family hydrolase [bacterium]